MEALLFRFRGTNMLLAGPNPFSELETRFLFTHSFNMYLLSTSAVPGTVLGSGIQSNQDK